eukprot:7225213-Pyramimonas_sp.AAC.1
MLEKPKGPNALEFASNIRMLRLSDPDSLCSKVAALSYLPAILQNARGSTSLTLFWLPVTKDITAGAMAVEPSVAAVTNLFGGRFVKELCALRVGRSARVAALRT